MYVVEIKMIMLGSKCI